MNNFNIIYMEGKYNWFTVERRGRRSLHIGSSHLVVFLRTANGRPYKLVNVTYGVGCRGRQLLQIPICPLIIGRSFYDIIIPDNRKKIQSTVHCSLLMVLRDEQ